VFGGRRGLTAGSHNKSGREDELFHRSGRYTQMGEPSPVTLGRQEKFSLGVACFSRFVAAAHKPAHDERNDDPQNNREHSHHGRREKLTLQCIKN